MKNHKTLILLGILFSLLVACEKFSEHEKFQRPEWLPGKLYTTVSAQENLTLFAECLRLTELDTIIDVSGSWSVFAPTDAAINQYLSENKYASLSDIPMSELEKITEFHIVQNPWSYEQLQSLSAFGWRTKDDADTYSYAYKRQTILKNSNEKYWIKKQFNKEMIVMDSTQSNSYKRVFVQSRKNVPIFYDMYLNINGITSNDFEFYFNRPYEAGNVYFAGARIIQSDIFAENGFLHIIDKLVPPMLNAKEFLDREIPGESYKLFQELVFWYYPSFEPNMSATNNQPGLRLGEQVDTLWDLNYAGLAFAPHQERIGYVGSELNESWVRHNGLIAPKDDAFREFIDGILTVNSGFPHWRDHRSLPQDVADIIVLPHFKSAPIYPSTNNYSRIFKGKGRFKQKEEDIIRKEFGSNSTFIGLNSYIPDRLFTSVTAPVFLRPTYSLFRQAIQYSNIADVIANHNGELYFFPIPDFALRADSSLMMNWIDKDENRYNFMAYDRNRREMVNLSRNNVRNMILDHVGTSVSNENTNKQIIRTLRGNNITWDHSNNTIQGIFPSTLGYNGNIAVTCTPVPLDEPTDNGKTWSINYWLKTGN